MIYRIYASDPRFKAVEFQSGLNIILADKKSESDKKDSRNGLGKTTLINIIHFCLGADFNKRSKKILPLDTIKDWTFFIEMDVCGEKITASRSIENHGIIKVNGKLERLPIAPEKDKDQGFDFYKLEDWRRLLGISHFGLSSTSRTKYAPSFRSLVSYFIRTGIDAYSTPFNYFRSQKTWNTQVCNAFLLGLNWEHASDVQIIKDKDSAANSLNTAVKTGIVSSKGELEAERVRLQIEFDRERFALSEFKVHPQYQRLQEQANIITRSIHDVSNKNLMLRRKLERYQESVHSEQAPDLSDVEILYQEAGLTFGDTVKKTLAEAKKFHNDIVQNRKHFLQVEIEELKNQITQNDNAVKSDTSKRAEIMSVLSTHGALEEFTLLQEQLLVKKARLENIRQRISDIQEMSSRKKEIKAEKIELETKLQRDYEQSRSDWEKAVVGFNENSQALYNESGNLIINVSDNGYSFDVEIPRSSSEGVGKMKIFCYDLMLVNLFAKRGLINFLVHDSTIFDGVDSRQTAQALEHVHRKACESGFQYICTFNSDALPRGDFSSEFDVNSFIRLTLKDQDPKDSLMGFRFNE
ncbi:MAG: DUF2326 domain-containing protein [Rickettsiales bacterium]|nr:DUF2326 domain-containing protein [Rickettsiales bacterium]